MKNLKKLKMAPMACFGVLAVLVSLPAMARCATMEEALAARAAKDEAKLQAMADDEANDPQVRITAAHSLPPALAAAYLDTTFVENGYEYMYRTYVYVGGSTPSEQYGRTASITALTDSQSAAAGIQRKLVEKLVAEGEIDKAVGEARRLYGLTPVTSADLAASVNTIAGVLKAKAIKDGKGLKAGIAALNEYLEAVQKGTAGKHPFALIPIPASPANVAVLENSPDMKRAIWALLYGGKWQQANKKADTFLAISDAGTLPLAVDFKARALMGEAASPTAANEFLDTLK